MANKGFIIDSLECQIKTKKGKVLNIIDSNGGTISFDSETLEINGGLTTTALAKINTKDNLNITINSARFMMDMVELSTGGTSSSGSADFLHLLENFTITDNKITIPFAVKTGSVVIDGLTETLSETPATKEFKVTVASNSTDVTFFIGEFANDTVIPVSYEETISESYIVDVLTNSTTSTCSVKLQTPIYENDTDDSDVVGHIQFEVYKAQIIKKLNVDGGYKSAKTFDIEMSALDARRADKKLFSIKFIPKK